jgi:alkaline phosphatase D
MELGRRDFLKLGVAQALLPRFPASAQQTAFQVVRKNTPSVMQGATDDTKTQFSVLHNVTEKMSFSVTDPTGRTWDPDRAVLKTYKNHPKALTKIYFSGLQPNVDYTLHIMDAVNGQTIETRVFTTLDLNSPHLKIAICSCMDDTRHEPQIWNDLLSKRPDLIFFVGDSVYADKFAAGSIGATPDDLWSRFSEARATLEIYFAKKLIPVFATWDDHDFGRNNAGIGYGYVRESQENFRTFYAQETSHCSLLSRGPGISQVLRMAKQQFIFLDCRSFRDFNGSKARFAHWGQVQEEWALNRISEFAGTSWLINGSQFFPRSLSGESVSQSHPVNLSATLRELKRIQKRIVFVSGDVHYTELSRIEESILGFETFEITSSSIHSRNPPGFPFLMPNPRRIASVGARNYVLVKTKSNGAGADFEITSHSSQGLTHFQKNFRI